MLSGLEMFYDSATVMYKANSAADNSTSISFAKTIMALLQNCQSLNYQMNIKTITPVGQNRAGYTQHFATELKIKPKF